MSNENKAKIASFLFQLKKAFPQQNADFFDVLMERMIYYNFTEDEAKISVNEVIDNFEYKDLTVASVIRKTLSKRPKKDEKQCRWKSPSGEYTGTIRQYEIAVNQNKPYPVELLEYIE